MLPNQATQKKYLCTCLYLPNADKFDIEINNPVLSRLSQFYDLYTISITYWRTT